MTTKHTPGPWTKEDAKGHIRILGYNNATGVHLVAEIPQHGINWFSEQDKANARLIASAPELLEAAKNLLNSWAHGDFVSTNKQDKETANKAIYTLSQAIAKAESR